MHRPEDLSNHPVVLRQVAGEALPPTNYVMVDRDGVLNRDDPRVARLAELCDVPEESASIISPTGSSADS